MTEMKMFIDAVKEKSNPENDFVFTRHDAEAMYLLHKRTRGERAAG
jgi:hypothetical protein